MAPSAEVPLDQLLEYKTWVLKVSIHCEGCKRKVNKVLHKINGVYTISIDSQQQRVTVTGNVGVETLIKRLVKAGKHAEIWPETLAGDEKKVAGKSKNNGKLKDSQSSGNNDNGNKNNNNNNQSTKMEAQAKVGSTTTSTETEKSTEREESQRSKERENSPENTPTGGAESKSSGGGGGSKKQNRQGQKGNNSNKIGAGSGYGSGPAGTGSQHHSNDQGTSQGVSLLNNHTQQRYSYPCYYPHGYYYYHNNWPSSSLAYANRSYTTRHPSKNHPQSWPYTCASCHREEIYNHGSFEIFSDENANGCFVM